MSCHLSGCSLTRDEFNLPHFVEGVGNETRCTLYGDFEGFARKNVRGSLGWCHMMISCLSFVSGLNVCNCSETMGVGGIMGVFLCCFVFWEGRSRERVKRF